MRINLRDLPDRNLLIGSLVNRAAELYLSYGNCGNRCNHPSGYCNDNFHRKLNCLNCGTNAMTDNYEDCIGCCLECSDEVHYHSSFRGAAYRSEYNCQKLAYYYTCRYSWKYCSELMYAFENVNLNRYGTYTVLSLGCGQSPDLMALEQINRTDSKSIFYIGYDINPYWANIHSEIQQYFQQPNNIHCYYETSDIFNILQNSNGGFANIIVISYFLSSLPDAERYIKAPLLFDLIINKVSAFKSNEPVLIIINDIDHNTKARNYFDVLIGKLRQEGYHLNVQKRHFSDRQGKDYGDMSMQYPSAINKFTIPSDISSNYHCAILCSSAQCIIEVN